MCPNHSTTYIACFKNDLIIYKEAIHEFIQKKSAGSNAQSISPGSDDLVDIDGNVYKAVKLGSQLWMAENLKGTRYRNGEEIPEVTDDDEWSELETGARCAYGNDEDNADTYGYLYNWHAVADKRNIAPEGWHVPTDLEYKVLKDYLLSLGRSGRDKNLGRYPHGSRLAGGADLWKHDELTSHSEFGTSGFSARPAGYRNYNDGNFCNLGINAYFWSATEVDTGRAFNWGLNYGHTEMSHDNAGKRYGHSVRLIRD